MKRRQFIKTGAILCTAAVAGSCASPPRLESLDSVRILARQFFNSVEPGTRQRFCIDYNHPMRQYHNRGLGLGGVRISGQLFSRQQIDWLNRLFYSGLSPAGREILPRQLYIRTLGIKSLRLMIAGDPNTTDYQIFLSGPHLNLRLGGKNREEVAFGGPQVYGDQRGNERQGLPKNVYRYQFLKADALFNSLDTDQRRRALFDRAPIQTQIELGGDEGTFAGVPIGSLSPRSREMAGQVIDAILQVYHPDEVAYAWDCLDHNGGIDQLCLSYYREGEVAQFGQYQIFRLEGPAAVLYFRGYPHVHAFINIGRHPNRPLSVGEELGENQQELAGDAVKTLFERAMKTALQTDFAYYDPEQVVGRLRKGIIRSGDIYNLESWEYYLNLVTIKGSRISGKFAAELKAAGTTWSSERNYTIATTHYSAQGAMRSTFGRGRSQSQLLLLRDATINYLKKYGFPRVPT